MREIRHHPGVSCYEHSVFVSYTAFRLAERMGLDSRTAARGGLLHDLYLYDPHTLHSYQQCFAHPVAPKEENIILAHMWPIARRRPHSGEAYAVCLADKVCAIAEVLQIWRRMRIYRALLR